MRALTIFALIELALAGLLDRRSRFTRSRITWAMWAAHMGASMLIWKAPSVGAWTSLMETPTPGKMITVAAATLALLLFTANFFHGAAKPEKDAETYFGTVLDTYLSRRSWLTDLLLASTFRAMVIFLFALPIAMTAVQRWLPAWGAALTAAWLAALGLVFAILLLNALNVLTISLRGLVRRESIRYQIRDGASAAFLTDFKRFLHGEDRGEVRETMDRLMTAMAVMLAWQQHAYLRATIDNFDIAKLLDARCKQAVLLVREDDSLRRRRRSRAETRRGNVGTPRDQAEAIIEIIDRVERECAASLATNQGHLDDVGVRERVISQLVAIAMGMHRRWNDMSNTDLAHVWLKTYWPDDEPWRRVVTRELDQSTTRQKVLQPAMDILTRVVELRFPPAEPTQCPPDQLWQLATTFHKVRHTETRQRLMTQFATKAIASTITNRHPGEALPIAAVREQLDLRRPRQDIQEQMQHALRSAAFTAPLTDTLPEDARAELLRYLTPTQAMASLIHVLMYRYRSNTKRADAALLRPYAHALRDVYGYTDIDRDELCRIALPDIDYFLHPGDIDWLLASLHQPADTDLVSAHLAYQHQNRAWLPLEALLVWRGTVTDIGYSWSIKTTAPILPAKWSTQPTGALLTAARVLDDIEDRRGQRLLANNPWAEADPEPS